MATAINSHHPFTAKEARDKRWRNPGRPTGDALSLPALKHRVSRGKSDDNAYIVKNGTPKHYIVTRPLFAKASTAQEVVDAAKERVAAVRTFWYKLALMKKHAELNAESKERIAERNAERPTLSWEETKRRECQWDLLHNEGGEGFNPYRA